jgi:outer membrane protein assembly factor BamA
VRGWSVVGIALCLTTFARVGGAQIANIICESGELEVWKLEFEGNQAFTDAVLERSIETTQSSWTRRTFDFLPFKSGKAWCLDSLTVRRDSARIGYLYRRSGFLESSVDTEIRRLSPSRASVRFNVREGRPTIATQVQVHGLDSVPEKERILRTIPLRSGGRFDVLAMESTRDSITRWLRNRGYPQAEVLRDYEIAEGLLEASVSFNVYPGRRSWIGEILPSVVARQGEDVQIEPPRVQRALGIRRGDLYRERDLEEAKRSLYLTDAFRHVDVSIDSASLADELDSLVNINVQVVETDLHATRVSAGWGRLDCMRVQGSYSNAYFMRGLRRLDLTGRLSKIGSGKPLRFAGGDWCDKKHVREDIFSDTLNYYVGATLTQPALFGVRTVPSVTLYSERRSETNAYLRSTPIGGVASVQHEFRRGLPMTLSYQLEYGRTQAEPALFCAVFNICESAAREALLEYNRSAVAGLALTRDRTDGVTNPTRGSVMRFELRHASVFTGSTRLVRFTRGLVDASLYRQLLSGGVLVLRLRAGTVFGGDIKVEGNVNRYIPPQERLYAGGPTTVRGFEQNELGAAIYRISGASRYDTVTVTDEGRTITVFQASDSSRSEPVAIGGDNVIVANAEVRLTSPFFPDRIQYVLFADAGEVWNKGRESTRANFQGLKVTPGVGVRVLTPIGPVRVDVGYNPYSRPPGAAYANPETVGRAIPPLYCVSPGNRLEVTLSDSGYAQQAAGDCPATFAPIPRQTFWNRLTFQFSIGQAF